MMNPQLMHRVAATRAFLADYEEQESHNQPISFGLSVGYPLNSWLSLSSGLVYTKLNSTFTTLMPNHQIQRHQKAPLHRRAPEPAEPPVAMAWHQPLSYCRRPSRLEYQSRIEYRWGESGDGQGSHAVVDRWQFGIGIPYHPSAESVCRAWHSALYR